MRDFITESEDEFLFKEALSHVDIGDIEQGKLVLKRLIILYPTTSFAAKSLITLYIIEKENQGYFLDLQSYLSSDTTIASHQALYSKAAYLSALCAVQIGDFQQALTAFQSVISDERCVEDDRVFARIDSYFLSLMMPSKGVFSNNELEIISKYRDELLSNLFGQIDSNDSKSVEDSELLKDLRVSHILKDKGSLLVKLDLKKEMSLLLSLFDINGVCVEKRELSKIDEGTHEQYFVLDPSKDFYVLSVINSDGQCVRVKLSTK